MTRLRNPLSNIAAVQQSVIDNYNEMRGCVYGYVCVCVCVCVHARMPARVCVIQWPFPPFIHTNTAE